MSVDCTTNYLREPTRLYTTGWLTGIMAPKSNYATIKFKEHYGFSTISDILKRHGIEPAPERSRKTTWKEFLNRHWELIVAADFFTIEVWTRQGLQRFVVLFVMELSTRRVAVVGIVAVSNGLWMNQIGRYLTDSADES